MTAPEGSPWLSPDHMQRLTCKLSEPFAQSLPFRAIGNLGACLNAVLGSRVSNQIGILTYHRVEETLPGLPPPHHNVPPEQFERQLKGLLKRGHKFIALCDLLNARRNNRHLPPKTTIVTFDDIFQSVYRHAWPVLQKHNIPATLFISTGYLDHDIPFHFDEWGVHFASHVPPEMIRGLTTAELLEMQADPLITIGAHTHTHNDFRGQPEVFRTDLQRSIDILEELTQTNSLPFAFPYGCPYKGFAGDDLITIAKETTLFCALTTEAVTVDHLQDDPFRWGRMNAFPWDTAATLSAKLCGWYSWAPKLRRAIKNTMRGRQTTFDKMNVEFVPADDEQVLTGDVR